jgi:hypothetical protein
VENGLTSCVTSMVIETTQGINSQLAQSSTAAREEKKSRTNIHQLRLFLFFGWETFE